MTSQKSFQQLTMEKEQALADLNSVERSLSDLFRRYENLKGVLEGFKKVVSFSVCLPAGVNRSPHLCQRGRQSFLWSSGPVGLVTFIPVKLGFLNFFSKRLCKQVIHLLIPLLGQVSEF
jgi:hypothetical protein